MATEAETALKDRLRSALGTLTRRLRMRPAFLVIGAQKCGTTSLYAALRQHPEVRMPQKKELHFFDNRYHLGWGWYMSYFPFRRGCGAITGEVSPYYIFHPAVPRRVAYDLPDSLFVVMLRNPVDRAYSHYSMQRRRGIEPCPTFEEAVAREAGRLEGQEAALLRDPRSRSFAHQKHSYLARGLYLTQMRRWLRHFPLCRFHVIRSEDLFSDTSGEMEKACEFLGIGRFTPPDLAPRFPGSYRPMDPALRRRLMEHYAPEIEGLQELLGADMGWSSAPGAGGS